MGDNIFTKLGYKLIEHEDTTKWRYEKETRYGIFSLTIRTDRREISANMIPSLLIVYESHIEGYANAFKDMIKDAKRIAEYSGYRLINEVK